MKLSDVKAKFLEVSNEAAKVYFENTLNGVDRGCCGFSWVTVIPEYKGNTKLGRAERAVLKELGFEKDYTGKRFEYWNPSEFRVQNIDTLESGSRAGAKYLKDTLGINAYASSRVD